MREEIDFVLIVQIKHFLFAKAMKILMRQYAAMRTQMATDGARCLKFKVSSMEKRDLAILIVLSLKMIHCADGVCLIAHGTWNENAEYFPLERCAKSGQECEGWKDEINGKKLVVNSEADHALGGMTTLNNVPTLFLPLYDSNGPNGYQEKWTDVFQFKGYEWTVLEKLDNNRGSFVPISVPKDFLCIEPP